VLRAPISTILTGVIAAYVSLVDPVTQAEQSKNHINTVREVRAALRACWAPPNISIEHADLSISVRLSFKRNGDMLGIPLITHTSRDISEDERRAYHAALNDALARCTPLPFSEAFGGVIAGRPINVRFH
jgi:hypothetical protein